MFTKSKLISLDYQIINGWRRKFSKWIVPIKISKLYFCWTLINIFSFVIFDLNSKINIDWSFISDRKENKIRSSLLQWTSISFWCFLERFLSLWLNQLWKVRSTKLMFISSRSFDRMIFLGAHFLFCLKKFLDEVTQCRMRVLRKMENYSTK